MWLSWIRTPPGFHPRAVRKECADSPQHRLWPFAHWRMSTGRRFASRIVASAPRCRRVERLAWAAACGPGQSLPTRGMPSFRLARMRGL